MSQSSSFWPVKIKGDLTVCVSPTIQQMTSYVLLEQEDWFEDEMDFIRAFVTPDMNALDIGANHGVYGLTIAKSLTSGHVWAFEPTVAPGGMLARSIELNGLADRIAWVHAGLSDRDGAAEISISDNSETNSLQGSGNRRETIALHTLDGFMSRQAIDAAIDFVKLDAEGEEIRILAGGTDFFTRQSPLVMFELRHGSAINHGLIEAFEALGYGIYRLVPGLGILTEYTADFDDSFLLNLFACKTNRADQLAERGLLARAEDVEVVANLPLEAHWRERLFALPFARTHEAGWKEIAAIPLADHDLALSAALLARDTSLPAPRRLALLQKALALATTIADTGKGDVALWLLRLNLTNMAGERGLSIGIARKLASLTPATIATLKLPFLPPSPRFDGRDLGPHFESLVDMLQEFLEYRQGYSNYFGGSQIETLSRQTSRPGHGLELDRRLILMARRRGLSLKISRDHPLFADGVANSAIWRSIAGV